MGNGMASGPLKDTSLEAAQKEIQRRLLRSQKLKRIEREEMRGLAAMGWNPPVEGAAGSGSSVHDAADAIEEAEGRRRAHAQEARRRAGESEAAGRTFLWHDANLNPDATLMESENVHITYSENLDTKTVRKSETLQANWYGAGRFTVVVTVAHASIDTTDMPMQVKTAGFIDGIETEDLSIDIAGQVVHMEGVIRRAKFPVDDDHGHVHTLKLHAENKSGFDVEVGLEVNGVRQVPLRLPVVGPLVP
jgi:hypothetical protein